MYLAQLENPQLQKFNIDIEAIDLDASGIDHPTSPADFQNFLFQYLIQYRIDPSYYSIPHTNAIEIDHDGIKGQYADGGWLPLVKRYCEYWAQRHNFMFPATLWLLDAPSLNFETVSMSVYLAGFGFAPTFLPQLHRYLAHHLGKDHVRLDADELFSIQDGRDWIPKIHMQYAKAWTQWDKEDPVWREIRCRAEDDND